MSIDTKLGTARQFLQDVIAPEIGVLKVSLVALHDRVDQKFDTLQKQIDQRFTAEREHVDLKFKAEREHVDQKFKAEREYVDQRFDKIDLRFDAMDQRFASEREHTDQRFDAIMAEFRYQRERSELQTRTILDAYSSFIAHNDLSSVKAVVSDLMIRVAVLESRVLGSAKTLESGPAQ